MLREPDRFKKAMLDAKHELRGRHGALGLGAEPADPRRPAAVAPARAGAPAAATVATAAAGMPRRRPARAGAGARRPIPTR